MHVSGHEHVSVDGKAVLGAGAFKAIEKEQIIGLGTEYRIAVVTALDNVKRDAFGKETWQTGHDVMRVP